jgi:putative transposase
VILKNTPIQLINLLKTENESRRNWIVYRFEYHAKNNDRIQDFKVWQDGYHGIACDNPEILIQKLNYIHNNPVRAGIVSNPKDYLYSSAANYCGEEGVINVSVLDTYLP